jgi:[acyl-carrier-protein] S-malonyltransferase
MSLGLLFPGQGTQHAGMLPWLGHGCEPLVWLAQRLGPDWRDRLADPNWSSRNTTAQCLLTALSLAAWQQLGPLLPAPVAVAGYSVGELAAFSVAGVFDAAAALELATQRARIMDQCVAGHDTGLLSVSGARTGLIELACSRHGLAVAIRIGPDRAVLGGLTAALQAAQDELQVVGATCSRLNVAIASHTPWLAAGVPALADVLAGLPFKAPQLALVCNYSGATLRRGAELRHALAAQIAQTVCWDQCMDTLAERRVSCVLEVGPGTTLSRMWQMRDPQIPVRSIDEFSHPLAVACWVRDAMA